MKPFEMSPAGKKLKELHDAAADPQETKAALRRFLEQNMRAPELDPARCADLYFLTMTTAANLPPKLALSFYEAAAGFAKTGCGFSEAISALERAQAIRPTKERQAEIATLAKLLRVPAAHESAATAAAVEGAHGVRTGAGISGSSPIVGLHGVTFRPRGSRPEPAC